MATVDLFAQAKELHQRKDLQGAEQLYREVLGKDPKHKDALHQLGALLAQQYGKSKLDEAARLIRSAIQLAPGNAKYRHSLGVVLEQAGDLEGALDTVERANDKEPMNVPTLLHSMIL